jgi:hypothetical protein
MVFLLGPLLGTEPATAALIGAVEDLVEARR